MRLLADKIIKLQAIVIVSILLVFILLGQLAVILVTDDFKQTMIEHDYALAGYFARSGLDIDDIKSALTSEKTYEDYKTGQALLNTAGYSSALQIGLLPEAEQVQRNYMVIAFVLTLTLGIVLIAVLCFFTLKYNRRLENADESIRRFMDGDTIIRLEDSDEGNLSRLFASMNAMATSLTAHIEKEKQSRQYLKDTISDVSHQLKTPLAALKMYNDIIGDEKTGNEIVESFTSKNHRELDRMENIIQSLLRLAKLDAGTIEIEKSRHGLNEFLEECVKSFQTRAELEGKDISLLCEGDIELAFDTTWLMEAVGNVVKNALDHTENGNRIEITCSQSAVAVEITVKDDGSGIHPEDIHHIFKRFYRSRFSKDRQGVGIGLSLSKAIVEKHGGTITVQSELGNGAAFHIVFPKLTNL